MYWKILNPSIDKNLRLKSFFVTKICIYILIRSATKGTHILKKNILQTRSLLSPNNHHLQRFLWEVFTLLKIRPYLYHLTPQPKPKPHTLAQQIYQTQTPQSFYTPNLYPNFIYSCTNVTACTLTHFFSTNFSPLVIFNRHMQGERGGSVSSIF